MRNQRILPRAALALGAVLTLLGCDARGQTRTPRPDDAALRRRLTPIQDQVTQEDATEPPFQNAFWNNHEPGIYVDIVSGEPLFSSTDKYDSGTGWPSFTEPANLEHVELRPDNSLFMRRTEVVCKHCDAHLGHVFDDGPADKGGQRYCINGCALELKPAAQADSD